MDTTEEQFLCKEIPKSQKEFSLERVLLRADTIPSLLNGLQTTSSNPLTDLPPTKEQNMDHNNTCIVHATKALRSTKCMLGEKNLIMHTFAR